MNCNSRIRENLNAKPCWLRVNLCISGMPAYQSRVRKCARVGMALQQEAGAEPRRRARTTMDDALAAARPKHSVGSRQSEHRTRHEITSRTTTERPCSIMIVTK